MTDSEAALPEVQHQNRFGLITCGDHGNGKTTLLGRMLIEADHVEHGKLQDWINGHKEEAEQAPDFAAIQLIEQLDSSLAPEQMGYPAIAFESHSRQFTIADTTGEEPYALNLLKTAPRIDAALLIVDASKGLSERTRRHATVSSLLGIQHLVIVVNKMDSVQFDQATFNELLTHCNSLSEKLRFASVEMIPVVAKSGDNVAHPSTSMPWYQGPTLLAYIKELGAGDSMLDSPSRFQVSSTEAANLHHQGVYGKILAGSLSVGDSVRILPSGKTAIIKDISRDGSRTSTAIVEQQVTLTLDREVAVSAGDLLAAADAPCEVADQFDVSVIWTSQEDGFVGRSYAFTMGSNELNATLTGIKSKYELQTHELLPTDTFKQNEIGRATLSLDRGIAYETWEACPPLGSFILTDPYANTVVATGLINFALRRAKNVHHQALEIDKKTRAQLNGHAGKVLWFTGLSGSGKSSIANAVEQALYSRGMHTYILDGDNIRHGLNKDLGFTDADRVENIRRIAEVAKLMVDAGLVVLTAFISPFRSERDMARSMFEDGEFVEIYVDVPLDVAEARDPKGLYKKARRGDLPNFTGIDSAYEEPLAPELVLQSAQSTVDECVESVLDWVELIASSGPRSQE